MEWDILKKMLHRNGYNNTEIRQALRGVGTVCAFHVKIGFTGYSPHFQVYRVLE